jgi:hypothetical protein
VGGCCAHHVADHAAAGRPGSTWPVDGAAGPAPAVGSLLGTARLGGRVVLIDQPTLTPTNNLTAEGVATAHEVRICVLTVGCTCSR